MPYFSYAPISFAIHAPAAIAPTVEKPKTTFLSSAARADAAETKRNTPAATKTLIRLTNSTSPLKILLRIWQFPGSPPDSFPPPRTRGWIEEGLNGLNDWNGRNGSYPGLNSRRKNSLTRGHTRSARYG